MATVTTTVIETVTRTLNGTASATASATARAAPQGGILEGLNPTHYDSKSPITLFIIQAGIVIIFCRFLHWPLSLMRQPRVIAEVIGGILLGPSVMGRIPGFSDTIFPQASMPNFNLIANLGLVLFLFLVGLEVDLRFLVSNWRTALSVGAAGMALPFGLGCAIAYGLYKDFHGEDGTLPIGFGTYMLFIAIAMAITAFPVLCRILTELKLLGTHVGVIVLSAGVGNDVVGWVLLALCVALVNANNGITALYILLVSVGYILFLAYGVRPVFIWILRRNRALQDGPSQSIVALTLLIALTSAFFTNVIGIHAIFGAFAAGLICPHEGGFAIKLTEKIEDLVSTLFLPLYFALSGLNTNLGLLDSGLAWGYVVGVTTIAFVAKIAGGSGAARLNGLVWRECFTIGCLMSCKGLVELIVLNIGLQARILSQRTFTIFVVMALVTTFATTPLVQWLYPPWYQKKLEAWKRGEIDWDTGKPVGLIEGDEATSAEKAEAEKVSKVLVYLRIDNMPSMLALTALFGGANQSLRKATEDNASHDKSVAAGIDNSPHALSLHGVRLLQLSDRESSVMKVSEVDEYSAFDPVVNTFRAFGRLHSISVSGEVAVVPESYYAETITSRAAEMSSDLILVPWSETGSLSEFRTLDSEGLQHKLASGPYREFVQGVLDNARSHAAIFVNSGFGGVMKNGPRHLSRTLSGISMRSQPEEVAQPLFNQGHDVFVPFFGTADDRVAVRFVLQLALDPRVTVTIVHFRASGASTPGSVEEIETVSAAPKGSAPKSKAASTTDASLAHDRAQAFLVALRMSLPGSVASRVTVDSASVASTEAAAIATAVAERAGTAAAERRGATAANSGDLIVVGRNAAGHDAADDESSSSAAASAPTLGALGSALVALPAGLGASLLVVQAAKMRSG